MDRAFHFGAPDVATDYDPSYRELRRVFEEIRALPSDGRVERQVLTSNGMTVAQFCTWYLVYRVLPTR